TICSNQCVDTDTDTDTDNCGSCGNTCTTSVDGAQAVCNGGSCAEECVLSEQTLCSGAGVCADLDTNDDHCGS
ncbi:MAG: hypothetical protein ABEK29_05090, partial [Bradymonadaceae bacterium]